MVLTRERKPLGQILLGKGLLQPAQLDRALEEQRLGNHQKLLGEILVELRQCTEEQIAAVLAESYGVPFARIGPRLADPKVLSMLPRPFLENNHVLPLFLVEGTLTVAVAEPADLVLREEIERLSRLTVQLVAATARDIVATLQTYLPDDGVFVIDDVAQEVDPQAFTLLGAATAASAPAGGTGNASAVNKLVNYCLYNAVRQGASDILIEPAGDALRVRYRIDGRLVERMRPPLAMHESVMARLKEIADADPARSDIPQEGECHARIDRRPVTLRISTLPGGGGESASIHVRVSDTAVLRLEKLGFGYDMLKQWRKLLSLRSGFVLVTGPAGSGKSTMLQSVLRELNVAELNVCTVEECITASVEGTRQLQVSPAAGLTTAAAIATVLRHDPDVLMVSALRDAESAQLLAEAATSGKLVFAGLQAPDAPSAVMRLVHMGIEPYVLGSALAGVLAQRLVRRLCPACKTPAEPTPAEKKLLQKWGADFTTLYRGPGCANCHHIGYAGRIGLHELLVPDEQLRERLSQGLALPDLRNLAQNAGLKPLRNDGLDKIKSGITTLEEVHRALA